MEILYRFCSILNFKLIMLIGLTVIIYYVVNIYFLYKKVDKQKILYKKKDLEKGIGEIVDFKEVKVNSVIHYRPIVLFGNSQYVPDMYLTEQMISDLKLAKVNVYFNKEYKYIEILELRKNYILRAVAVSTIVMILTSILTYFSYMGGKL